MKYQTEEQATIAEREARFNDWVAGSEYRFIAPGLAHHPLIQLERPDFLALDVDGVILDVSDSIKVAVMRTADLYLQDWGWDLQGALTPSIISRFKQAGGFNNDWYLLEAFLLYLEKGGDPSEEALQEFTKQIAGKGGGLKAAQALLGLGTVDPNRIRRYFFRLYAGEEHGPKLYGLDPQECQGIRGSLSQERVILDRDLLSTIQVPYGLITGRNTAEARFVLANLGITPRHMVTEDSPYPKPDPRGFAALVQAMGGGVGWLVGDTIDDWRACQGQGWFCGVCSGAHGLEALTIFSKHGAQLLASDLNALLRWLNLC